MTDWAIPQQAKLKYTQLFNLHDRTRSGFLSGLQCRDILLQSGLPRNVLAEIWNLSDIDGDGQLAREEFILALHLTNHVRAGQSLPTELPPDLVPPSYRRTSSISSSTSVQSASSASIPVPGSRAEEQTPNSQKQVHSAASVLSTNSFEDKRRENFEKGKAELERRRLKVIEQQFEVLREQLETNKKQVSEAKSKIDAMRSDRDAKMGLLTSLEAQIKALQDRKEYLRQEEQSLLVIAKDLNLVNSSQAEPDQMAEQAKQQNIDQMKVKINEFAKEKEEKNKDLEECSARLAESKKEVKTLAEKAEKIYEDYTQKIKNAKVLRDQYATQSKAQIENLDSVWNSLPSYSNDASKQTSVAPIDDPWSSNQQQTATNAASLFTSAFDTPSESETTTAYNNQVFDIATKCQALSLNDSKQLPSSQVPRKMYKALYAFEARNPDELTINPGDIITGSNIPQEPGWLSGDVGGRSGLFPEAYVEPFVEQISNVIEGFDEPKQEEFKKPVAHVLSSALADSESSIKKSRASQASQKPAIRYKAIYAFEARNPDELTINPGDIITGSNTIQEPGWLSGELSGQTGLFPEAYVEKIDAIATEQEEIPNVGKSKSKRPEVATVLANYRALGPEQLSLEKGQLVSIRRKMDSGWWEGEIQIKGKKKQYGWFPANYVKLLPMSGNNTSSTTINNNNNDEPQITVSQS